MEEEHTISISLISEGLQGPWALLQLGPSSKINSFDQDFWRYAVLEKVQQTEIEAVAYASARNQLI